MMLSINAPLANTCVATFNQQLKKKVNWLVRYRKKRTRSAYVADTVNHEFSKYDSRLTQRDCGTWRPAGSCQRPGFPAWSRV